MKLPSESGRFVPEDAWNRDNEDLEDKFRPNPEIVDAINDVEDDILDRIDAERAGDVPEKDLPEDSEEYRRRAQERMDREEAEDAEAEEDKIYAMEGIDHMEPLSIVDPKLKEKDPKDELPTQERTAINRASWYSRQYNRPKPDTPNQETIASARQIRKGMKDSEESKAA